MLILGGNFSAWAFTLGFAKTNSWARARDQGTIVFAENYFARITPCTNVYPRFYSRFKIAITRGFGRLDWRVKGQLIMEARTSNIFKDARYIVIQRATENVPISMAIMTRNYLPAYNYRRIVSRRGKAIEERSMLFTSLPPQRQEERASIAISRRLHTDSNLHHTIFTPFNYIEMQYQTYLCVIYTRALYVLLYLINFYFYIYMYMAVLLFNRIFNLNIYRYIFHL